MKTVVPIVSGGLDSVTMLYDLVERGDKIRHVVSFNYGQRHRKELLFAAEHADRLDVEHVVIDLHRSGLERILSKASSVLVNCSNYVPEGHYAEDNMKATVVPNRNMVMLALAGSVAVATNAEKVAIAVHSGDHFIYPDCRPEFIDALDEALHLGNLGFGAETGTGLHAPFIYKSKADIAELAIQLDVPLWLTWSCYVGGSKHCGRCGTCVERLEAIAEAEKRLGLTNCDETEYEDTTYWKKALAQGPVT